MKTDAVWDYIKNCPACEELGKLVELEDDTLFEKKSKKCPECKTNYEIIFPYEERI